jgi:cyclophilin family peptidyl-prolyl cis-trans isomerase
MKKITLILLCLLADLNLATAAEPASDEVALIKIKLPNQEDTVRAIIEFYDSDAPQTVENFKRLARKGFYNGLAFHRTFPHILIQAGDPLSRKKDRSHIGIGGPGYTLQPEIRRKHIVGAVAAARLPDKINPGRVSNGSQFYICLKAQPNFDGQYTVFGHVTDGLDGLDKISQVAADSNDNPLDRIEIQSVKILPRSKAEIEFSKKDHPSKLLRFIGL